MANQPTIPIVPDHEAARTQSFFTKDQIYFGPTGTGAIVPRVGNIVLETTASGARLWEVASVDEVSNTPSMNPINLDTSANTSESVIIGGGIGSSYNKLRIWVNKDRVPYTLNFDSRIWMDNPAASHVKIFKGVDVTDDGRVISAMYDTSGNKISENIPLTLIQQPNAQNLARKAPVSAWCQENVTMYETVTVVSYTSDGSPCGSDTATIMVGDLVASLDRSKPYVRAISLISDFLSVSDNTLLEYPVGMTVASDAMKCRVVYSDGRIVELPIDGNKVALHGLTEMVSSESGRTTPLRLAYRLAEDELGEDTSVASPERYKSVPYRARAVTTEDDVSYNVKMFVVPQWISGANARWKLRYFLYSLERTDVYEVTDLVQLGAASPAFSGNSYGIVQNLTMVVNLAEVSNRFRYHRHPQQFSIALAGPGSSNIASTYWNINYADDINYGQGRKATFIDDPDNAGAKRIRIDNGFTVQAEWINNMYTSLVPLYNTIAEASPPKPTHIRLRIGATWQREIEITSVLDAINNVDTTITQGMDIRLEFIRRTDDNVLELAMGSLTATSI